MTPEELYNMQPIEHQTPAQRANQFGEPMPGPTTQQRRMMQQRRQRFEEMRKAREQQRAMERIKQQVVYSPVLASPQRLGYAPMPPGMNIPRDPRLGVPIGIDEQSLSPQDQALYQHMLAMNTGGRP